MARPPPENSRPVPVPASVAGANAPPDPPALTPQKSAKNAGNRHRQEKEAYKTPQQDPAQLPEELRFLCEPRCTPNLKDSATRKVGYMRQANAILHASTMSSTKGLQGKTRRCQFFRQVTGLIILSWPVQTIMVLVILFDCTVTIITLASEQTLGQTEDGEEHIVVKVADYLVVILLSIDVLGRFFFEGLMFLRLKLNLLELFLVPVTITEVFFLKGLDLPVPLLRALRPVLRSVRIIRILVRTAGKGASYLAYLRRQVSGERIRFTQDGFDLDLAYVSGQIIAMSLPGTGYERLLHNPYTDVACFLNERHGNRYLLLNTTHEQRYPLKPFFGRYYHFPIDHQGVPSLEEFWHLCEILDCFLKANEENVVAVHSHHGQGRVSMVVIALLLYRGTCPTVASSIAHVEHNRASSLGDGESTTQTLDNTSQKRFLEYFGQMCLTRAAKRVARPAKLKKIALHGISASRIDLKIFLPGCSPASGDASASSNMAMTSQMTSESGISKDTTATMDDSSVQKKMSLIERVTKVINESTLDSVQAGCQPIRGRPLWMAASGMEGSPTSSSFGQPAVWEVPEDTVLNGEFRLEFHRKPNGEKAALLRKSQKERMKRRGKKCLRCCLRKKANRGTVQENLAKVHSGMLFAFWLHAGYLEHDEPTDSTSSKRTAVMVELDRFSLDKAANAPTMRSYSTGLKIQLFFEVDHRIEWSQAEEEDQLMEAFAVVPPSANMSESYSLEWLTWVSKRVWPSFTNGFEQLIRNNVMPSLKESLPGPLKNIRLAQCSFGNDFPRFGQINASSRTMDGLEVQLDIQLNYSTAVNIVLDAGFVSFGISRLQISGVLSLRFKPILGELPVFSAMQLLFLNLPEVDLRFARNLEIANSSRVRNIIFGSINKALCDLMVLPNIININWADPDDDGTSSVSFRNVLPCSILRLKVIEAKDLYIESSVFKRAPDTFVKVQLGAQVAQTPVISKNSSPVWGKEFDFLVYDEQQHLNATAMDVDYSGRTHAIGTISRLPVLSVATAGNDGQWLNLKKASNGASRGGGDLLISGAMFELEPDVEMLEKYITPNAPAVRAILTSTKSPAQPANGDLEDPPEPEELEEAEDAEAAERSATEFRSGSTALLIVEVFGGQCPPELAAASSLDVRVSLGKAEEKSRCVDAQKVDPGAVSEKSRKSLEKLAALGMDANAIAESLGEDIADVQRLLRKRGWNLELPQKLCVLATEADLCGATHVEVSVHVKKKCLATAAVPITRVLQAPGLRHTEVVTCKSTKHRHRIDLDAEFRMFVLKHQSVDL